MWQMSTNKLLGGSHATPQLAPSSPAELEGQSKKNVVYIYSQSIRVTPSPCPGVGYWPALSTLPLRWSGGTPSPPGNPTLAPPSTLRPIVAEREGLQFARLRLLVSLLILSAWSPQTPGPAKRDCCSVIGVEIYAAVPACLLDVAIHPCSQQLIIGSQRDGEQCASSRPIGWVLLPRVSVLGQSKPSSTRAHTAWCLSKILYNNYLYYNITLIIGIVQAHKVHKLGRDW